MFDPNSPEFTRPVQTTVNENVRFQLFVARHRPFFILVGVLVAQLLLLSVQITRNNNVRLIRVWAVAVFDPFERTLGKAAGAVAQAWRTYTGLWGAHQQNQELKIQLVAERTRAQQLSEQAAEAQRLRTLLDFKERLPFQSVAAEVIASSPGENSGAVFIDKGTDSGLAADLPVVTPEGIIGKIVVAFPQSSQVLLITDSSSGAGIMLERSRVQGVLKGTSHSQCQVLYVMNEEKVTPGEAVLTSGMDQVYPKGLPVGTVVRTGDGNIYKDILVKPAAELNRLEAVLVLLKPSSVPQQAANNPAHH